MTTTLRSSPAGRPLAALLLGLPLLAACSSDPQPEPGPAQQTPVRANDRSSSGSSTGSADADRAYAQMESESSPAQPAYGQPTYGQPTYGHLTGEPGPAGRRDTTTQQGQPNAAERGEDMGLLEDMAIDLERARQEAQEVAENYFRTGRAHFEARRYAEAEQDLMQAISLDRYHVDAWELLERVRPLVSDRPREPNETLEALAAERQAIVDQKRHEVERLFAEGEQLLASQRYSQAEERFARVLEILEWFPYELEGNRSLQTEAERLLRQAAEAQDGRRSTRRDRLEDAAREAAGRERDRQGR
jgi:tetratricopeptide (TPR) repeat protein